MVAERAGTGGRSAPPSPQGGTALRTLPPRRGEGVRWPDSSGTDTCDVAERERACIGGALTADDGDRTLGDVTKGSGDTGIGGGCTERGELITTLGKDRFDAREGGLYAGGGGMLLVLGLRPSERGVLGVLGVSSLWPPIFSMDPPIVRRDIMREKRPERLLDESKDSTLAFAIDGRGGSASSGGPSSRNAISSRADWEMYGCLCDAILAGAPWRGAFERTLISST